MPYTLSGRVWDWAFVVKIETMYSSSDRVKDINAPETMAGKKIGDDDFPEGLGWGGAEILCGFLKKGVETLKPCLYTHEDERETEGRMGDDHRDMTEWQFEQVDKFRRILTP